MRAVSAVVCDSVGVDTAAERTQAVLVGVAGKVGVVTFVFVSGRTSSASLAARLSQSAIVCVTTVPASVGPPDDELELELPLELPLADEPELPLEEPLLLLLEEPPLLDEPLFASVDASPLPDPLPSLPPLLVLVEEVPEELPLDELPPDELPPEELPAEELLPEPDELLPPPDDDEPPVELAPDEPPELVPPPSSELPLSVLPHDVGPNAAAQIANAPTMRMRGLMVVSSRICQPAARDERTAAGHVPVDVCG